MSQAGGGADVDVPEKPAPAPAPAPPESRVCPLLEEEEEEDEDAPPRPPPPPTPRFPTTLFSRADDDEPPPPNRGRSFIHVNSSRVALTHLLRDQPYVHLSTPISDCKKNTRTRRSSASLTHVNESQMIRVPGTQ